jgi:hypothetical protein
MAKISARGATAIYRLRSEHPAVPGYHEAYVTLELLRSDGWILRRCPPGGWTRTAKLQAGVNPADWLNFKLSQGWKLDKERL